MKKLLALFLFCAATVNAQLSVVTWTATITNTPTNGDFIVVNGTTAYFTNNVLNPLTQISTTNTQVAVGSNLVSWFGSAGNLNASITRTGATNFIIRGASAVVSCATNWLVLSSSANASGAQQTFTTPLRNGYTLAQATNIASAAEKDISDLSTNAADQNSKFMSQEVGTTNTQTVSGNKAFSGSNNFAGIMVATNPANVFSGTFGGEGTFTGVTTFLNDVLGGGAIIYYQFLIADGSGYFANNAFSWDGLGNVVAKSFSGNGAGLTNLNATNLTAGTIPNARYGTVTNLSVSGTNTINAAVVETIFNNISIVSTGNAVNSDVATGTNAIVFLSGASAPFGIAGFAGGIPDRVVIVQSGIGQAWTNMYQSGQESTVANRIINPTGANIVIPAFGALMMRYDGSASVWRVMFATGN